MNIIETLLLEFSGEEINESKLFNKYNEKKLKWKTDKGEEIIQLMTNKSINDAINYLTVKNNNIPLINYFINIFMKELENRNKKEIFNELEIKITKNFSNIIIEKYKEFIVNIEPNLIYDMSIDYNVKKDNDSISNITIYYKNNTSSSIYLKNTDAEHVYDTIRNAIYENINFK